MSVTATNLVRSGGIGLLLIGVVLTHAYRAGTIVLPLWVTVGLALAGAIMVAYRIRSHWAQGLVMFAALVLMSLGIRYL